MIILFFKWYVAFELRYPFVRIGKRRWLPEYGFHLAQLLIGVGLILVCCWLRGWF